MSVKNYTISLLFIFTALSVSSQDYKYILGANFSFGYNKSESYLSGNNIVTISSDNKTSFLFGSFIAPKLTLGGGVGLNSSKFLSDDGTNVFEESARGFNVYPDVRYYIPLKKMSVFMEGTIYLGYSEKTNQFNRPTTAFDNGIKIKSGIGVFLKHFYIEASITAIDFSRNRTTTPVDNTSDRINEQTSFTMLEDFTNISIGLFYHFGKTIYHTPKPK
jgi:hypothetical protein